MKQVLQYLWIEKNGCIEKQEFNFTRRSSFHYDSKSGKLSLNNNEDYCYDFFGKNIELSCIVGKNGSGKTSLLEFIMHITDKKPFVSNCIIALYENDSLMVYHTGIVKEYKGNSKIILKNDDGSFLLDSAIDSDIVYYTYAFNYNQFNQQFTKVQNYSPAYMFSNNSEIIKMEHGDAVRLTDISKSYNCIIHNQLDFICKDDGIWKEFGIQKPTKMKIFLQNNRKNALIELADKFYENKEDSQKQKEQLLIMQSTFAEVYQEFYDKCNKIESEFDIRDLCENFFDYKTDDQFEAQINKIAVELMNSFIEEMKEGNPWFGFIDYSDNTSFDFLRYLHKIFLEINGETKYEGLKRAHCFFSNVKNMEFCSESSYLRQPKAEGEKWRMWNIDKYKDYTGYLLEFVDFTDKQITCDEKDCFEISINNNVNTIANPIRFYDEYYKIARVYDFLSFSYGLSSGEMALINVLSCLYNAINYRINPYKIEKESANFIFMIDEADMLLHPEWQRKIISSFVSFLKPYSENYTMQLIIATHSPIMLSDIPKQNVLFLNKGEDEYRECDTFASNIFQLFRERFFIGDTGIGAFAEEKLKDIVKYIHGEKNDDGEIPDDNEIKKLISTVGDAFLRNKLREEYMLYRSKDNMVERKQAEIIAALESSNNSLIEKQRELRNDSIGILKEIQNAFTNQTAFHEKTMIKREEQDLMDKIGDVLSKFLAEAEENDD